MKIDVVQVLEQHGIRASAQRVAVAEYVLGATDHPSADGVWAGVKAKFPTISRATVYNVLNLFVEKGILRELHLAPGSVLFDPKMDRHHHFIDEDTGEIHDVPWDQCEVSNVKPMPGFEVHDFQVVMRGRRRTARR